VVAFVGPAREGQVDCSSGQVVVDLVDADHLTVEHRVESRSERSDLAAYSEAVDGRLAGEWELIDFAGYDDLYLAAARVEPRFLVQRSRVQPGVGDPVHTRRRKGLVALVDPDPLLAETSGRCSAKRGARG